MIFWLDTTGGKPWVAQITGLDPKFGLARTFLGPVDRKTGQRAYLLNPGVLYQVHPTDGEERHFIVIQEDDQTIKVLDTEAAMALVQAMEAKKPKIPDEDVEAAMRRVNFNSEGGFSLN